MNKLKTILVLIALAFSLSITQLAFTQTEDSNTESEFDALFGDEEDTVESESFEIDEIEDPEPDTAEATEDEDFTDPRLPSEDRASTGGWYLDEYQIRYRPTGHADPFIKTWADVSTNQNTENFSRVFENITNEESPGACFKCHSIDKVNDGTKVNWKVRQSNPRNHEFNKFSHVAHFNLLQQDGCSTCHKFDKDADYASGFKDQDPLTFASNFQSISEQTCIQCHQEDKVGESCLTCHNYHIGKFEPTVTSEIKVSTEE